MLRFLCRIALAEAQPSQPPALPPSAAREALCGSEGGPDTNRYLPVLTIFAQNPSSSLCLGGMWCIIGLKEGGGGVGSESLFSFSCHPYSVPLNGRSLSPALTFNLHGTDARGKPAWRIPLNPVTMHQVGCGVPHSGGGRMHAARAHGGGSCCNDSSTTHL